MNSQILKSKLPLPTAQPSLQPTEATTTSKESKATKPQIFSSLFEVFGRVQGVYFRKHTKRKAKKLGVHGWCMNTSQGTVRGIIEGTLEQITDMKYWLRHKGSPRCEIEKAVFSENEPLPMHNYKGFFIRH